MGEDGGGGNVSGNIKLKNSCIGGTPQQELDFNWFFLQQNTHNYVLPRIHWFECNQGTSWIIFLSFHPSQQTNSAMWHAVELPRMLIDLLAPVQYLYSQTTASLYQYQPGSYMNISRDLMWYVSRSVH